MNENFRFFLFSLIIYSILTLLFFMLKTPLPRFLFLACNLYIYIDAHINITIVVVVSTLFHLVLCQKISCLRICNLSKMHSKFIFLENLYRDIYGIKQTSYIISSEISCRKITVFRLIKMRFKTNYLYQRFEFTFAIKFTTRSIA